MTVSRALRNSPSVRAATREGVIAAAEKLGYHAPLKSGRPSVDLSKHRSSVEVVVGLVGMKLSSFYSELLTAMEQGLNDDGRDCIFRTFSGKYADYLALRDALKKSPAEETVIVGYFGVDVLQGLLDLKPDALIVDNPGCAALRGNYSAIGFDNAEAARMGVRHLLERTRTDVLLLSGFKEHYFSRDIEQGYRDALTSAGIGIDNNLVRHCDFTVDGASSEIRDAVESGLAFDAIFTTDEMACGVYRALREKNRKIPDDIAVCGCDGLPIGEHIYPKLTTIRLNYTKLGRMAIELLAGRRSGDIPPSRTKLLPELLIRESS
ncbi:MAG: LacI family transcriptional regulator [Candidatus Pacebacteria bacterium]|nr:LacI family transcriptional regulator [Candidatus Paceibacterota bacterium]